VGSVTCARKFDDGRYGLCEGTGEAYFDQTPAGPSLGQLRRKEILERERR